MIIADKDENGPCSDHDFSFIILCWVIVASIFGIVFLVVSKPLTRIDKYYISISIPQGTKSISIEI